MLPCRRCPENAIEFYCKDCKELICSKCLFYHHNGHQLCLVEDTLEVLMVDLDELDQYYSKKFSEEYNVNESNDKQLVATINQIEQNKNKQIKYVRQAFEEIMDALIRRKDTVLVETTERFDNEKMNLAKVAKSTIKKRKQVKDIRVKIQDLKNIPTSGDKTLMAKKVQSINDFIQQSKAMINEVVLDSNRQFSIKKEFKPSPLDTTQAVDYILRLLFKEGAMPPIETDARSAHNKSHASDKRFGSRQDSFTNSRGKFLTNI